MNKIHIKYLSNDAMAFLKKNIASVTQKLMDNEENNWIYETFPQPMFIEKKYYMDDFTLDLNEDSKDKGIDFENSKKIYNGLKDLPRYILCDERFWLWLHFEKFYKSVKSMVKINGQSTVLNMWTHEQGTRRGLMFGVLSRCYFRVALTIDETLKDQYELTKWVIENPERYRNLTWRSFSSEEHLVRGIIKGEKKVCDEYTSDKNYVSAYTALSKEILRMGSVELLDAISEEDIEERVYIKLKELIQEKVK